MRQPINGDSFDQGDSRRLQIWIKWKERKRPTQIAEEIGEPVQQVYLELTLLQKTLTHQIGVNHVRRKP